MPTDATFLLFTDHRMPNGGYAHSGGLEQAVASGRVRSDGDLEQFLVGRLATSGLADAALATAARLAGSVGPWEILDAESSARTPSAALRSIARGQGGRVLRLARHTWHASHLDALATATHGRPMWPVAFGAAATAAGVEAHSVALAAAAVSVTTPAWAAVRCMSIDPFVVAGILADLATAIDSVASQAMDAATHRPLSELPAASPLLLDFGAEEHARWEVRLFAS